MSWANIYRKLRAFLKIPFKYNAPVNENAHNWNFYRLSQARMSSPQGHSIHWRATCSYPTYGIDFRDYLRGNFKDFNIFDYNGSGKCMKVEHVNIRGHMRACTWQRVSGRFLTPTPYTLIAVVPVASLTQDLVQCQAKITLAGYAWSINSKFRCTEGPHDNSVVVWSSSVSR